MIRIETEDGWILAAHQDHAKLAGIFSQHWGNEQFEAPKPFESIYLAVAHHDDAWSVPDSKPSLTPEGQPSAFSKELVGTYDAFEEIDLENYLKIRGEATEMMASRDPLAAVLISMHTVNLLTEQADLSQLDPAEKELHSEFISSQLERQNVLRKEANEKAGSEFEVTEAWLQSAFEFLQACDSFSLISCVQYPDSLPLRHQHKDKSGNPQTITCKPIGKHSYSLEPYPLDQPELSLSLPVKIIGQKTFKDENDFREKYSNAPTQTITIKVGKESE